MGVPYKKAHLTHSYEATATIPFFKTGATQFLSLIPLGTCDSRRQPSYDLRCCLLTGIPKPFLSALVFSPELENVLLYDAVAS